MPVLTRTAPKSAGAMWRRRGRFLDVQVDDTRVIDDQLYRVRFIHPDRRIMTQFDMELVAANWPAYIYLTDDNGVFVTDEYGTPIVGL
jgi:hypothetical protein